MAKEKTKAQPAFRSPKKGAVQRRSSAPEDLAVAALRERMFDELQQAIDARTPEPPPGAMRISEMASALGYDPHKPAPNRFYAAAAELVRSGKWKKVRVGNRVYYMPNRADQKERKG